jgi:hypothetical protein
VVGVAFSFSSAFDVIEGGVFAAAAFLSSDAIR